MKTEVQSFNVGYKKKCSDICNKRTVCVLPQHRVSGLSLWLVLVSWDILSPSGLSFSMGRSSSGQECLSASSSSSTYFIHLYIRTPTLSFSNLLNAFLLTSVVYNSPPPTFIINVPMLYLQLKRNCTWHKSIQLLVHGSHIILTVLKYFSPALGK